MADPVELETQKYHELARQVRVDTFSEHDQGKDFINGILAYQGDDLEWEPVVTEVYGSGNITSVETDWYGAVSCLIPARARQVKLSDGTYSRPIAVFEADSPDNGKLLYTIYDRRDRFISAKVVGDLMGPTAEAARAAEVAYGRIADIGAGS